VGNKLLTLKELRQKIWWWRQPEILSRIKSEVCWEDMERAARNYELMRRSPKGRKFTRKFSEFGRDERTLVFSAWPPPPKQQYRTAYNRTQFGERGWTPVHENQYRQWNLKLSDSDLIKEFIREIRILRKIQKIRAPHPLKGQKFRITWNAIQILDRKQNKIGKLNDSQRSAASKAEKTAIRLCAEYRRASAKWEKLIKSLPNPGSFEAIDDEEMRGLSVFKASI
jgi:hypothetical protein